jgi:tetratricopeptide (TPR) repeat protein
MNHIASHLRDIFFNKKTGRLVYRRGNILKYFFFQKGVIFQVKTNQPDERLGEILYKLDRIPQEAHAKIEAYIEPNRNLGEVLKSRGVISEEDLVEALSHQIRESVLNIFPYFDAELDFQEHPGYGSEVGESRTSIPLLIEYGIRRMQADQLLQAFLARRTPTQGRKTYVYLLTAEEKDILEKVNGKDAAEVILRTLTMPPDQFWKSLYLFYCLGIVEFESEAKEARRESDPVKPSAEGPRSDIPPQVAAVLAFRKTLSSMTFYQILDIPRTAGEEDVKKAYFQMARRFHPDRFERKFVVEYKDQIDAVFDAITNAYRTLSNKEARRIYDIKSGSAMTQEDVQDSFRKAEIKFRQGKTLHAQGRIDEAIAYLEEAVRVRKDKGDYYLLLAMAESKVPAYVQKAEQDFLKAIQLEPWNPEGFVGLGLLYKAEGLQTKAVKQFEKALEAEPDHATALEALEELTGRIKKKGVRGPFGLNLFGSKKKKK